MECECVEQKYSVLMSVYAKEKAEYLRTSMESIFNQTVQPDDFVLVCDGPLGDELNKVIEYMLEKYKDILQVVRLENNVGLGRALNEGIKKCKNELVARMDSDDISRPERCEKQLEVFKRYPEVSVVSGIVEEFSITPEFVEAERILPEMHDDIKTFAKNRNPFNHPCVMYRKKAVEDAGGYRDFYLLEDYFLWVRMLQNGSVGYNLQEPLLWMRAGSDMYRRRSGWKYAKSQISFFKYMYQIRFITKAEEIRNSISRVIVALMPNGLRTSLFVKLLRTTR